jgi:uncharacterized membrane protein YtjA (UPF0391 family)
MFKRAHISAVIGLIAATLGFLDLVDGTIAQALFYLFMAFATLSLLLGMFEADDAPAQITRSGLQPRRIE